MPTSEITSTLLYLPGVVAVDAITTNKQATAYDGA